MNTQEDVNSIPGEVEKILCSCPSLPSLPAAVVKIIDASKDPEIGIAEVSDIIRIDPALSAKILKIANSPMYSIRREIHNLREALSLLGLDAAISVALSFSLYRALNENDASGIEHEQYWKRSILAATIARQIGIKLGLPNLEDLFLAGLLQDIGILALDSAANELHLAHNQPLATHKDRIKFELDSLGIDHSNIGAWLLKSWRLPKKLYQAVLNSHPKEKIAVIQKKNVIFVIVSVYQVNWLTSGWVKAQMKSFRTNSMKHRKNLATTNLNSANSSMISTIFCLKCPTCLISNSLMMKYAKRSFVKRAHY